MAASAVGALSAATLVQFALGVDLDGLTRTGEVLQQGGMVTTTYTELETEGAVTFDIQGGKIAAQWMMIETFK